MFKFSTIYIALDISISRSMFAKLRPKNILYKNTLPHSVCVCVVHENIDLLLVVLSKEVNGLKSNLSDFLSKMVCDEAEEICMMSRCDTCKNNFNEYISKKIIDKKKIINWYQWVNNHGRTTKQNFSGNNEFLPYLHYVRIKNVFLSSSNFINREILHFFLDFILFF